MKNADQIMNYGRIKPYFDRSYSFNTIDIETVDNELFILGLTSDRHHETYEDRFYEVFHDFLIECVRNKKDVLTWTRYDNTNLLKLILKNEKPAMIRKALDRIGYVSPILEYTHEGFTFNQKRDKGLYSILGQRS